LLRINDVFFFLKKRVFLDHIKKIEALTMLKIQRKMSFVRVKIFQHYMSSTPDSQGGEIK
jgi:hypothetical protein